MADVPATRFARNGDVHLAYQVIGDGPIDLLFVDDWVHHVELIWEVAEYARFLRRLSGFARFIHFDRRGTGLSDPVPPDALPDLETQVADVMAILDAAGSKRPAVFAVQVGSLIAMLLAATHPERCRQLVLYAPSAISMDAPDFPHDNALGTVDVIVDTMVREMENGAEGMIPGLAPSRATDTRFISSVARMTRSAVRPGTMGHFFRQSLLTDLRDILPTIAVPTLVLHRKGDSVIPVALGRQVASLIPGASLHELDGDDHFPFTGDSDAIIDEVEEAVTGTRTGAEPDRVLATLLFTDIVDSTRTAADLGDRRWHALLDEHRILVRRDIERFRGRELATTGDGFLATFDGPARAVRCAQAIVRAATDIGLGVRAGVHAGEFDLRENDASGLTVHIASRVAGLAGAGEVFASSTVKDLLAGSGIDFEARGEHELKGVPDTWRLFAATG
jgi:class 3 adenylate cyclase/pimeloyl-ACP methyl ester carboxylesterase